MFPRRHVGLLWAALVSGVVIGGCSQRRVEDAEVRIEQACEAVCPVSTTCDPAFVDETVEACIADCTSSDDWDELDQCDWGSTAFMLCLGTLSCEQLLEYNSFVMEGTILSPAWPCLVELDWLYNCNPDQPFAQPE